MFNFIVFTPSRNYTMREREFLSTVLHWRGRSELAIDYKQKIWARLSKKKEICSTSIVQYMFESSKENPDNVSYPKFSCLFGM